MGRDEAGQVGEVEKGRTLEEGQAYRTGLGRLGSGEESVDAEEEGELDGTTEGRLVIRPGKWVIRFGYGLDQIRVGSCLG